MKRLRTKCRMDLQEGNEMRNAGERNLIVTNVLGGIKSGDRKKSASGRGRFRNY